jgi:hypothetical protein
MFKTPAGQGIGSSAGHTIHEIVNTQLSASAFRSEFILCLYSCMLNTWRWPTSQAGRVEMSLSIERVVAAAAEL